MANESPSGLVWKSGGAFEGPDWQKVLGAELQRLKGEVCVCVAALCTMERL